MTATLNDKVTIATEVAFYVRSNADLPRCRAYAISQGALLLLDESEDFFRETSELSVEAWAYRCERLFERKGMTLD